MVESWAPVLMEKTKVNSTIQTLRGTLCRFPECALIALMSISGCIKDNNGRDCKSHILKHSVKSGHANGSYYNFKIIS